MPVNIIILVFPNLDIPAQTWTLNGCFTVGFNLARQFFFLKHKQAWRSNQILDSSVKMTLLNVSFCAKQSAAKIKRSIWFADRTIWQYLGPDFIHPSFLLISFTDDTDVTSWNFSFNFRCKSTAVSSSEFSYSSSMKSKCLF